MKLDKRLLVCAEMTEGSFVCDIGTDHGYLPAYLLRSGKCTKAIAADIGEKPLAAAKATFENEGIEGGQLILSDGLKISLLTALPISSLQEWAASLSPK